MGTYCRIILKDSVPEVEIERINQEIGEKGFPTEVIDGVPYGAFYTEAMIHEDVRFMNEDPEGLKQAPHWKRPITVDYLERNWNFTCRRQFCWKFGGEDSDKIIRMVATWANNNKQLIDEEESSVWTEQDLAERNLFSIAPQGGELIMARFIVDLPTTGTSWEEVGSFDTRKEAIAWCKEKFGANDQGMVSLVSKVAAENEDEDEDEDDETT